jgi:hypothetical protein
VFAIKVQLPATSCNELLCCYFSGEGTFQWPLQSGSFKEGTTYCGPVCGVAFTASSSFPLKLLQVKEPNLEKLARGKVVYEPPRYMTINTVSASLVA